MHGGQRHRIIRGIDRQYSKKNFESPEERVELPGISEHLLEIGGMTVCRTVQDPGWRWSEHVKPVVGGEWCEARHVGVVISGAWGAILRDGTELEFGPGDVYDMPPGHDGYTIGDEPCVLIEWMGMRALAGRLGEFHERALVTLLFTDIVESTATLLGAGDSAWHERLQMHYATVRVELERFRGREVNSTGDGMLAVFDAPARALRCASAIRRRAAREGLDIRAGVHAGEVVVAGSDVRGLAVHEAARIMSKAGAGEVLVSATTRALVQGTGLEFEDRGEHELKGLPEPRRLYAFLDTRGS